MVVPSDISPLFCVGRLFGCGSQFVVGEDIKVTRRSLIFTLLWFTVYIVAGSMTLLFYAEDRQLETKLLVLSITRVLLSYLCLFADVALTALWNWKIRAALSQLRTFDRATKFTNARKGIKVKCLCYIVLLIILVFWSIAGYISYRWEGTMSFFRGVTYATVNGAISMQILSFFGISFLLHERFHRLCKILLCSEEQSGTMGIDRSSGQFRLPEIWWLHCCLANATEMVNSAYAIQLLLWIACMSFNTLSRLYTLNENQLSISLTIRETMLVTGCVGNLLLITIVCHITSSKANRVGEIVFLPQSPALIKRPLAQENVEAVAYFQLRKVHFFALPGFIRIDLPLLLSIASAITTYLVILHASNYESNHLH